MALRPGARRPTPMSPPAEYAGEGGDGSATAASAPAEEPRSAPCGTTGQRVEHSRSFWLAVAAAECDASPFARRAGRWSSRAAVFARQFRIPNGRRLRRSGRPGRRGPPRRIGRFPAREGVAVQVFLGRPGAAREASPAWPDRAPPRCRRLPGLAWPARRAFLAAGDQRRRGLWRAVRRRLGSDGLPFVSWADAHAVGDLAHCGTVGMARREDGRRGAALGVLERRAPAP